MKKSILVGLFSLFMMALLVAGFVGFHFINSRPSQSTEQVVFEVSQGASFQRVADELEKLKLVRNAELLSWYARVRGDDSRIKVGEYSLRRNMTPAEVLTVITSGKSIGRPFTVVEGLNIYEIADLYQQSGFGKSEDFLNFVLDREFVKSLLGEERDSLEGYLFPETYQLTKFTTVKELIQAMVARFNAVYPDVEKQSQIKGLTKHEIVTLASIVEKETGAPEERPRISSIFHNRLQKGMRLQTDPTIIYGMAEQARQTVYKITKADILRPTRYNTYVIKGLPPGPIGNPGREALLAAVQPEKTNYLFFVSQNDGTHIFSEDYESHNRAVRKFQQDPKAREGKSWRDLQKKKGAPSSAISDKSPARGG
jgi:UPF0755 protein